MPENRAATTLCCLCHHQRQCAWCVTLKGYVCGSCTRMYFYSTPNEALVGRSQKRLPSFSVEFEVALANNHPDEALDRALILLKYGFIRTDDRSVDEEFKSPIFRDLRSFRRPLAAMEQLADLVTDRCGTHLHIACQHKDLLE